MEYKEQETRAEYRPLFGYGYDPEREEKELVAALDQPKEYRNGMPRPKGSPWALLFATIVVLAALFVGALFATHIETQFFAKAHPAILRHAVS